MTNDWKGKFVDGGGNSAGRVKKVRKGMTERYECLRCDTEQIESVLARSRGGRVRCRHCGNVAYPMSAAAEPEKEERRCAECNTKLRESNTEKLCGPCDMKKREVPR